MRNPSHEDGACALAAGLFVCFRSPPPFSPPPPARPPPPPKNQKKRERKRKEEHARHRHCSIPSITLSFPVNASFSNATSLSFSFRSNLRRNQIRASKPEGCTFKPKTNSRRKSSSPSSSSSQASRFDKLYLQAKKSKARLDRRRTEQRIKPTGCTFSPSTNVNKKKSSAASSASKLVPLVPLSVTVRRCRQNEGEGARERERRLAAAGTFKPKITRKAALGYVPLCAVERLYRDGCRDLQVQRAKQRADLEMRDYVLAAHQ